MAYVMVIEDDEAVVDVAAPVLRNAGHAVHVESDTESAAERMKAKLPDPVVLDAMVAGGAAAGFQPARAMRQGLARERRRGRNPFRGSARPRCPWADRPRRQHPSLPPCRRTAVSALR